MKKNILVGFFATTTIALSSSLYSMELVIHTSQQALNPKTLTYQGENNIPFTKENETQSTPTTTHSVFPYNLAKKQYLRWKKRLNLKIENKTNILVSEWDSYLKSLENYYDVIPNTQSEQKKKILQTIEKTETTIEQKNRQLGYKNRVNNQKKRILKKIEQKKKVTLEDLIAYRISLIRYIQNLPNREMQKVPLETSDMVADKIDTLARALCEDIQFNTKKHNECELNTNYDTLTALQIYFDVLGLTNNYEIAAKLKRFINHQSARKQKSLSNRAIRIHNQQPKFSLDAIIEEDEQSENESSENS